MIQLPRILTCFALGLGASCASLPSDANRLQPGLAPTPFSAAEIRAGCPDGRRVEFMIERPGQPTVWQWTTFSRGTEDDVKIEVLVTDEAARPLAEPRVARASWTELQEHASFVAAQTTIRPTTHKTREGTWDCWLYVVTDSESPETRTLYWFAKELPGPPICVENVIDGELQMRMTMVESGR